MPRFNIKAKQLPDVLSLPPQTQPPAAPSEGDVALYTRRRAGYDFLEIMRANGRDISMQPHFGINRIALWTPAATSAINTLGLNNGSSGTRSTPTPAAGNLAVSSRRWAMASAATAGAATEDRGATAFMWRGNAPGLGGFISILRFRITALQAGANGFFGLVNSVAALTVLDLTAAGNTGQHVGLGFKQGVHANWQVAHKGAATSALTFIDLGPDFPINDPACVITLYIFSPQNGASIHVRVVREDTGKIAEFELSDQATIPQPTAMLTPRLHVDNGATAAAVSFECYGLYCETDY